MPVPLLPVLVGGKALATTGGVLLPVAKTLVAGGTVVSAGATVVKGLRSVHDLVKGSGDDDRASPEAPQASGTRRPGSSPAEASGGPPAFDDEQRGHIQLIANEVASAPLPQALAASRPALTVAMVVNAWHESRLRAGAMNLVGDDSSYGLFQVNRQGALGRPYSPDQLLDPLVNTRVILSEVWTRRAPLEAVTSSGSIADLVAAFTEHVERPADRVLRGYERAATARAWYGPAVERPAYRWNA